MSIVTVDGVPVRTITNVGVQGPAGAPGDNSTLTHVVRNSTGTLIPAGVLVETTGGTGPVARVAVANPAVSTGVAGWTLEAIANNATGLVLTSGTATGLNTNAFSGGDPIWLGPSGTLVNTLPTSGFVIRVGKVAAVHPSVGSVIMALPSFPELAEGMQYDPTASGLAATNVQDALDELEARLTAGGL